MTTVNSISIELKNLLNTKFRNPSQLVVLAGAGISLDPPSRLPLALPLMQIIIDAISPTPEIRETLNKACLPDRIDQKGPNNFLRLERLLELVYRANSEPRAIVELSSAEPPNSLHFALARLGSLGTIILTTNFDCLIEKACQMLGLNWKIIVNENDFKVFDMDALSPNTCYILKLHGSADQPKSIQTTLEQVGAGRTGWSFDQPKGKTVKKILEQRNLLVVGYSGSDDFDVVPALIQIRSQGAVLWMEHDESKKLSDALLQNSHSLNAKSKSSDILLRMIESRMNGKPSRNPSDVWKVTGTTREVLQLLAEQTAEQTSTIAIPVSDVGRRVLELLKDDCQKRYDLVEQKWHTAALLFRELENQTLAIECVSKGRELALQNNEIQFGGDFSALLGMLLYDQGDHERAFQLLDEAQILAGQISDKKCLSMVMTKKAAILRERGKIEEAITLLKKAIELDKEISKLDWQAMDLAHLAIAIADKDPDAAKNYHEQGLKLARDVGDMRTELKHLNDFKLLRGLQSNDSEVLEKLERAEELAISLGDLRGLVEVKGNRGMTFADRGQFDIALSLMSEAELLAASLNYFEGVARWKSEAAHILVKRGDSQKALQMLKDSLKIFEKLSITKGRGGEHGRLGLLYKEMGNYNNAAIHLQMALKYDEAEGWSQGVVDDLQNLGTLSQAVGDHDSAFEYFSEAVRRARELKYEAALARNLGNLGVELSNRGKHREAFECDKEALDLNIKLGNREGEAYTRRNLAGDLLEFGKKTEALIELRKTYAIAKELGLKNLIDSTRQILAHFGVSA